MTIIYPAKKNILVITEGGKNIGFGHISRCEAICDEFKKKEFDIIFAVNGDETISRFISNPIIFNWGTNKKNLFQLIKDADIILIDSFNISNQLIISIEKIGIPVILIDDDIRRNILNKGFVVDWTILGEKGNKFIPRKNDVNYLLGTRYAALKKDFYNAGKVIIREKINNVMISLGGSDIRNLNLTLVNHFITRYPGVELSVVVGPGVDNVDHLNMIKNKNVNLLFNLNASQMINIMLSSDLAITVGGQTLYELACLGLPSLGILTVENAREDILGWDEVGFIKNLGSWNDNLFLDNLDSQFSFVNKRSTREIMQKRAKDYIDGRGAQRLVNKILTIYNDLI